MADVTVVAYEIPDTDDKNTIRVINAVKTLAAGVGTELYFGIVLKTPEVSHEYDTNTDTTLISETKTLASTDV